MVITSIAKSASPRATIPIMPDTVPSFCTPPQSSSSGVTILYLEMGNIALNLVILKVKIARKSDFVDQNHITNLHVILKFKIVIFKIIFKDKFKDHLH